MAYSDIVSRLERKMDDDNTINRQHSTLSKYHFVDEAIRYINNQIFCCTKPAYFVLKPHIDTYDIPSDFIRVEDIVDIKQCSLTQIVSLTPKDYLRQQIKSSGDPHYFQILEREFKMLIDAYPSTARGIQYYFYDIDTTEQYIHIYSSLTPGSDTFTNWFNGTVIKLESVNGSGAIEYIKIGEVSDEVVTFGVDDINMKKVYYTQRDILETGEVTPGESDLINMIDLDMLYTFLPESSIEDAVIDTIGTTVSTNVELAAGYIIIYGSQERTLLDDHTIDSAFSSNLTAASVYVIRASDSVPMPINVQEYLADVAKIYAFENEARDQEAIIQKQYVDTLLAPMKAHEVQEALANYNNQRHYNPLV